MKKFIAVCEISGRASVEIEANSLEEAEIKAANFDFKDGTDRLIEWEFTGDVESVEGSDD